MKCIIWNNEEINLRNLSNYKLYKQDQIDEQYSDENNSPNIERTLIKNGIKGDTNLDRIEKNNFRIVKLKEDGSINIEKPIFENDIDIS